MTTEQCPHSEDAPLLALGALDADEAAELRAHAQTCPECRRALAEHEALVGKLDQAFEREPAPSFDDLVVPRPPVVRPAPAMRRRRTAWIGGAVAACAAAAIALVALLGGGSAGPAALASLKSELPGGTTSGQAKLFHPDRPDGVLELSLRDVPPAPAGSYYAVWVLPRGQKAMEAVGAFTPKGRSVDLTLSLPGRGDYGAVDISIQKTGGPSAHSGHSLAGGAFRAT